MGSRKRAPSPALRRCVAIGCRQLVALHRLMCRAHRRLTPYPLALELEAAARATVGARTSAPWQELTRLTAVARDVVRRAELEARR